MTNEDKPSFKQQDKVGKFGENEIALPYLEKLGHKCIQVDNVNKADRSFYDFKCHCGNGKTALVEVKTDVKALVYGNFCLEYEQHGKKSGINITKSTIWIHLTGTYMYIFQTDKLKAYANSYKGKEEDKGFTGSYGPMRAFNINIKKVIEDLDPVRIKLPPKKTAELIRVWEGVNKKELRQRYAG